MEKDKNYFCIFCGNLIFPEEGFKDPNIYYIFHCENAECQAIYESRGKKIPKIYVYYNPWKNDL